MLFFRTLFVGLIALVAFGCSGNLNVAGKYATEVSQGSGKEVVVGDLDLQPNGQYRAQVGQLQMSGTWTSSGSQVFLQGADDVSRFLPSHYRVDGSRLIAQLEGIDAKQWRFVKKSETLANRLH